MRKTKKIGKQTKTIIYSPSQNILLSSLNYHFKYTSFAFLPIYISNLLKFPHVWFLFIQARGFYPVF